MRIESVTVLEVPFEMTGFHTCVQICTDSGITGLGQSGGWGFQRAVGEMIRELTPMLIGQDPYRIEHLWNLLYRARPFRGNMESSAIAAIDNALWDIKGKGLQVPVWELLGGKYRDKVRLHALIGDKNPDVLAQQVKWAVDQGFTAVKFDPLSEGYADRSMPNLIESACELGDIARQVGGKDLDIIFELHRKLDPARGVEVANALAAFKPLFIEDPIQIDSIASQALVSKRINSPVATGERLNNLWEYKELLSYGIPIIVRPDIGMSGGLTSCKKIAVVAEAHHAGVVPHNFLGPGITAPTLHFCLSIPNLVTMEYLPLDEDLSSSSGLIRTSAKRSGGYMSAPDEVGLGIELLGNLDDYKVGTQKMISVEGHLRADGSVMRAV
jgi:galactonate dehydratase